ncbi:MAG: SpoIIE family protein phosphatase [Acidobacteriota bacterium]|nr:SpoIIE family protein phosphatase [Acidobacteriota bacterium]
MKSLKRIFRQQRDQLGRRLRPARAWLTPARSLLGAEALALCAVLAFLLTGDRADFFDRVGGRADVWLALAAVAALVALHLFVNRRLVPALNRRFAIERYDERRILFDLGRAGRTVTSVEQLYGIVAGTIGDALGAPSVTIFVRDDQTGRYECRFFTVQLNGGGAGDPRGAGTGGESGLQSLAFERDAVVVKRLYNLTIPLSLEPRDLETWRRSLELVPPETRGRRRDEIRTLEAVGARLLLQIMLKDRLIGIMSLGARRDGRPYTLEDRRMLMSVAGQMAFIIENAKLVEQMVEEGRLRRELALASEVQQQLFPAAPPESAVLDLAGFCQPAREIGGDYYDFLLLDNEQIGVAVADVAGKGISAALLMSTVQASLRSQAMALNPGLGVEGSLADLVATMNRLLWRSTGAASYVTFFYAQFDEQTRRLTYVNAGHNPPLLVRASGVGAEQHGMRENGKGFARANGVKDNGGFSDGGVALTSAFEETMWPDDAAAALTANHSGVLRLSVGGPVLGVLEDCFYYQETIEMREGDMLVAYTDGVTEALNAVGEEFGEAGLRATLVACAHLSADEVRVRIVERVREWSRGAPQHDDLTFVVLKVK